MLCLYILIFSLCNIYEEVLYTSFSIYVTYVINLGRRQKHKKEDRRNFCKYVLNKVSLRGRINGTEGRLAGFMFLHIAPYVIRDMPLPLSRQSEVKKMYQRKKEKMKEKIGGKRNMKNKIVGIFVCMLLIATAVPAVTSLKINITPNTSLEGMRTLDVIRPTLRSHQNSISNNLQAPLDGVWNEEQKLLASDGDANASLGAATIIDGDTALIGACWDDDNGAKSGSAYVFTRTGDTWTQQAKLLPSDGHADAEFGTMVSLDGDTALVGAYFDNDNGNHSGSAYVFTRTGTTWTQQAKLLLSDGVADAQYGIATAVSGDTAFVGANRDDDNGFQSGSVYVFTRSGAVWTQQTKLYPSDATAGQRFGVATYILGDTAIIGANGDKNAVGAAYIFTRTGTTWTQQQKLNVSDGGSYPNFGHAVSLSGDTALIAAPGYAPNNPKGSAYVFVRNGTTWTRQQKLVASDGVAGDQFSCWAVSLEGDTALIGAWGYHHGANTGAAYVFVRSGTTWMEQQKLLASDGDVNHYFGNTVALAGNTALIGSPGDDINGIDSGSVYMFTRIGFTFSITGGLGVKADITNNGTIDATNISWQIHVEGGMLGMINKTVNGTVDIPAGKSVTVTTGILFGFGAISITAKVADEEQTATGTQLIIFSMVK